jgi:hypothetical protein
VTKFRAGDHVRIIHTPCAYFDRAATIAEVVDGQAHPYRVDGLAPWPLWFGADELTLAEPPAVTP